MREIWTLRPGFYRNSMHAVQQNREFFNKVVPAVIESKVGARDRIVRRSESHVGALAVRCWDSSLNACQPVSISDHLHVDPVCSPKLAIFEWCAVRCCACVRLTVAKRCSCSFVLQELCGWIHLNAMQRNFASTCVLSPTV